jgi:hypothetical protein
MYIISAIPGACSDIVSAVIDSTDCHLSPRGQILFLHQDRQLLKYPKIDESKISEMIETISGKYNSISSQYSKIINQQDVTNQYITVDVTDDYSLDWCIARLKILCPAKTFDKNNFKNEIVWHRDYADQIINLRDILSGNLISVLSDIVPTPLNEKLYQQWLTLINNKFPYNFV